MPLATPYPHPRCPQPRPDQRWPCLLATLLLVMLLPCQRAMAGEFTVKQASTALRDGIYTVDATLFYTLTGKPREALENGVPLTLELHMKILRQRQYLWSETIAEVTLRHRLQYRALSEQYQIENLSTGEINAFTSLTAALNHLRRIDDFPLIDRSLLDPDDHYEIALRTDLDIESLPTPLRALAYITSDWYLSSDWYQLPLPPSSP